MTTPLMALTETARSFFSLIFMLLCLINIFSIILSIVAKRYYFPALSLIPFSCCYFLWQILFDIQLGERTGNAVMIARKLADISFGRWLIAAILLSLVSLAIFIRVIIFSRQNVTPAAIKLCLDGMSCGVCCWRDDGRIVFLNACMNRLCIDLTGDHLIDGNHLYDMASGGILKTAGKVWRFSFYDIVLNGERLHETIASDITAEYSKTQVLEREKAELLRLNRELNDYNSNIDDTVRRQEILQAKINIHDEMNRLMLSAQAAGDQQQLDRVFALFEKNALLLCMESDKIALEQAYIRIEKLAEALKIALVFEGGIPSALNDKQRNLFFSAAQEAIVNASKHAEAKYMNISFSEDEEGIYCRFTNDGKVMPEQVKFTGGLSNLSQLVKGQGGSLSAKAGETFTLTLRFMRQK